ncbi:hypothetical protein IC744_03760 [Microbacterium hominis]|uniref:hypothetical protein n=1 Tax=Microbacterium TaxID=33882 RepID=UPI00168ACB92|nr:MULTISPECIES: hypothetical protein [Microbacterium]QOC25500.1 hypothetical protein IC745_14415 [Microbacterium hominis]QOC29507.1 hypothetical protein IC744_03760 [Microbacterium hominis]QYF98150.1 hypothetical protein KY498_02525 [Microbacterium sp. PAMC21962]
MAVELDAEHYEALGRLAAAAAHLESVVENFTMDAITPDTEVAVRVVSGMPFDRRVSLLSQLLETRLGVGHEDLKLVQTLLDNAKKAMQTRNRYLHGLWALNRDAETQVRNRVRKTGRFESLDVSASDVRHEADAITSIAVELELEYLDVLVDLGVYEPIEAGVLRRRQPYRPDLRSNGV